MGLFVGSSALPQLVNGRDEGDGKANGKESSHLGAKGGLLVTGPCERKVMVVVVACGPGDSRGAESANTLASS